MVSNSVLFSEWLKNKLYQYKSIIMHGGQIVILHELFLCCIKYLPTFFFYKIITTVECGLYN